MTRPLADSQKKVLLVLLDYEEKTGEGLTPNAIGYAMKVERVEGSGSGSGRGSGHRVFGPAQRIIPALIGLRRRGLTRMTWDPDRRRYPEILTVDGRAVAIALRGDAR